MAGQHGSGRPSLTRQKRQDVALLPGYILSCFLASTLIALHHGWVHQGTGRLKTDGLTHRVLYLTVRVVGGSEASSRV